MFIGRKAELAFLESKYEEKGGQLIVLYGRRRIGKTETLREFCKDKNHVFYSCREITDHLQRQAFSDKLLSAGHPAARYLKEFPDWESALISLTELPRAGKKLLVIDEFPYMCRNNPSIPSILQVLWDETLKDADVMIILCGSAMSFIENELLAEKNPLYGRATGIYKMLDMPFADVIKFFPDYSPQEQLTAYAVLGGIPHYLRQFNPQLTLEENIKKYILTKGCALYSEIEFLLRQELRETAIYNSIIETVALGNTSLNEIYNKTQIEKSKLSVYLKNLLDLQIIWREFSLSDHTKEKVNSSRGLYRLRDNFFRFWYAFVYPAYSDLEMADVGGVYEFIIKPKLHEYTSFIFEDVCQEYVRTQNRSNQLPQRYTKIGRWWGRVNRTILDESGKEKKHSYETEIDIMAIDQSGAHYLLGECKYKNSAFGLSDFRNLQQKWLTPAGTAGTLIYYLFSLNGFTDAVKSLEDDEPVHCLTLDEVVATLAE